MSSPWTHVICVDCWNRLHPDNQISTHDGSYSGNDPDEPHCCWCGAPTDSGIYLRADPKKVHGEPSEYTPRGG